MSHQWQRGTDDIGHCISRGKTIIRLTCTEAVLEFYEQLCTQGKPESEPRRSAGAESSLSIAKPDEIRRDRREPSLAKLVVVHRIGRIVREVEGNALVVLP